MNDSVDQRPEPAPGQVAEDDDARGGRHREVDEPRRGAAEEQLARREQRAVHEDDAGDRVHEQAPRGRCPGRTSGRRRATGAQPGPPGCTRRKKASSVAASVGGVRNVTASQATVVTPTIT